MRTEQISIYKFDELSDEAKEKAREWFREASAGDNFWSESVIEDAVEIARLMGLEIKTSTRNYHVMGRNGNPGRDGVENVTHVFWSGFWSQGDGACFEGTLSPVDDALKAVAGHAPVDERLHNIAADVQHAMSLTDKLMRVIITKRDHHYSHAHTMGYDYEYPDEEPDYLDDKAKDAAEAQVKQAMIAFANWIYRQLEQEYNYQNSDEQIDETIRSNEYDFTEDGKRWTRS